MIIPSIDIIDGNAVQLVGGDEKKKAIDGGDPFPLAETFNVVGEIAVIDLDAAFGREPNDKLVKGLLAKYRCRVGGGIRSVERAIELLDAGANKVILGTAATPEILSQLPADRVVVALDAVDGEVVVEGWQTKTGHSIADKMAELRPYCEEFMVTFVEKEGRMEGTDMARVKTLVDAVQGAKLTIAGGVTTPEELAELDRMGVDAQVGMALYSGQMNLAEAFAAPLLHHEKEQGPLWPTVVVDENNQALGLAWSNLESLKTAIEKKRGVYHSRKRGLWIKGETSGDHQDLLRVDLDCDRDALRFTVRQHGTGFCHLKTDTCWHDYRGLSRLYHTLQARKENPVEKSYTNRLLNDRELLRKKLIEEAGELADAETGSHVAFEAADLLYFATVALVSQGVSLDEVMNNLDAKAKKVTRRPGNAKE